MGYVQFWQRRLKTIDFLNGRFRSRYLYENHANDPETGKQSLEGSKSNNYAGQAIILHRPE